MSSAHQIEVDCSIAIAPVLLAFDTFFAQEGSHDIHWKIVFFP